MKFLLALLAGTVMLGSVTLASADPVDLRGKKGIVDPRDLKKYDPPQRPLHIKEPPPPSKK